MALVIGTKAIVSAAAVAGALATLGGVAYGAVHFATPFLESDAPPFVGRVEVAAVIGSLSSVQQQIQKQSQEDAARDKLLALTRQQQLESLLIGAKADYAKSPNQSTHAYVCDLWGQINGLRTINSLPSISMPSPSC